MVERDVFSLDHIVIEDYATVSRRIQSICSHLRSDVGYRHMEFIACHCSGNQFRQLPSELSTRTVHVCVASSRSKHDKTKSRKTLATNIAKKFCSLILQRKLKDGKKAYQIALIFQ